MGHFALCTDNLLKNVVIEKALPQQGKHLQKKDLVNLRYIKSINSLFI